MSNKLFEYLSEREKYRLVEKRKSYRKFDSKALDQGWTSKSVSSSRNGINLQTIEDKGIRNAALELITAYEKMKGTYVASTNDEEFYFENTEEYVVYCIFNKAKNVRWRSAGENYIKELQQGFQLYEEGRYEEAIEVLKNSLRLNPIGISARFELCEAYLKLGKLYEAKNALMEMKDYFIFDKHVAKFYRRMGFIATEEKKYQCAVACLMVSLKFENHPIVENELKYIKQISGINPSGLIFLEDILRQNGIPVIE